MKISKKLKKCYKLLRIVCCGPMCINDHQVDLNFLYACSGGYKEKRKTETEMG